MMREKFTAQFEKESDGRWICEIENANAAPSYGASPEEALTNAVQAMNVSDAFLVGS